MDDSGEGEAADTAGQSGVDTEADSTVEAVEGIEQEVGGAQQGLCLTDQPPSPPSVLTVGDGKVYKIED